MRSIPKSESIADIGLEAYLNKTKPQHNELGYDDFVRLINSGVNKANLARAFQVNRDTVRRWLKIYEEEQGNA